MRQVRISLAFTFLVLAGCEGIRAKQKSGTELETNADGHYGVVTNVTPEEYDRMTPAERQRLHAQVGVEVSARLWGSNDNAPRTVSAEDLDKSKKNSQTNP